MQLIERSISHLERCNAILGYRAIGLKCSGPEERVYHGTHIVPVLPTDIDFAVYDQAGNILPGIAVLARPAISRTSVEEHIPEVTMPTMLRIPPHHRAARSRQTSGRKVWGRGGARSGLSRKLGVRRGRRECRLVLSIGSPGLTLREARPMDRPA